MRRYGLRWGLLLALACCQALLSGRAETLKVFSLNLGQVNFANPEFAQGRADVAALLNDATKDVDFGYFCGPKSLDYFTLTDANYTFGKVMIVQAIGGIHVIAYRTDRYDLVKRYEKQSIGNGAVDACVLSNKGTGANYILLMPTGNQFNISAAGKINAYLKPILTLLETVKKDYPTAKAYVGTTKGWSVTDADLTAYLTGASYMNLREARVYGENGTAEAGGIYCEKDPTLSVSVANVPVTGISEPAAVATLTYASGHTVLFKDWDGTVLATEKVAAGADATPPADPVREGYDFTGWEGSYENVTEDCEVTATYAVKTFTVTFMDKDGSALAMRENVEWGTVATAPEPPLHDGMLFLGWDSDAYLSVKDNLVITAVYEELANIFTVRFLDADGTVLKSEQVVRGEAATAPNDPTPPAEGQVFYGWSPAVFSDIASDLDVTAVYGPAVREVGSLEDFATAITALPAVATLRLTADLDFAEATYVPPVLRGTVDGNGHVITNLKTALFETVSGGTVKDLTLRTSRRAHTGYNQKGGLLANRLEGATVSGVTVEDGVFTSPKSSCGLATIAYWAMPDASGTATVVSNCVARNCRMTGISSSLLGGIVGEASDGTLVVDCRFETDDPSQVALGQGPEKAGGIIALSQGATVVRCTAEGVFRCASGSQSAGVGGIVGSVGGNTTTLVACTNRASVVFAAANGSAGGLVGRGMKATCVITDCVNLGAVVVEGDENSVSTLGCGAGGLMGGAWGNAPVTLAGSRNEGAVTVHDFRSAGGLLGVSEGTDSGIAHVFVTNSVNVGAVTSAQDAGGLVGWVSKTEPDLTLLNCGNLGAVHSATGHVGGVVGAVNGMAQNNNKDFVFTRIANVMNAGALTTDSGTVGTFAGRLAASDRNAYAFALTGIFLPERGETPLVGEVVGKDGTGATADESCRLALPATAFADRTVVKALNVRAAAEGLAVWGQTALGPDLTLFVPVRQSGMIVIVR